RGREPRAGGRGAGPLRTPVAGGGRGPGRLQTRLVTSEAETPRPPVDLHTIVAGPGGGTAGPTGALGAERIVERVGGIEVEVSATAFLQTNTETADRLYATVGEFARLAGDERVFDLYRRVGALGL